LGLEKSDVAIPISLRAGDCRSSHQKLYEPDYPFLLPGYRTAEMKLKVLAAELKPY
jgi:hypothetical protein